MSEGTAWAAGFFDGEGSINIVRVKHSKNGTMSHVLSVEVSQVDPRPLQYLQEIWGGSIRVRQPSTKKAQPSYLWYVRNITAEKFLSEIRPYLRVKGEQADIALAFREIKAKIGGRRERDEEAFEKRDAMKRDLEGSR
jgi:hypothetical protein